VTYKRATAEALGEALGITVVDPEIPKAKASDADRIFDLLDQNLREEHRPAAPDPFAQYRIDLALRLSRHLRNVQAIGPALERQEASERAELLAAPVGSEGASEAKLLERIDASDPKDDEAIVAYLYRRCVREEVVWRGALGVGEGTKLQPLRF
jgi:hypothetical protein